MLCAARVNIGSPSLSPLAINIHKTPGSSRVGSGANPCSFVPQHYFSTTNTNKNDFEMMELDWRNVSKQYFSSIREASGTRNRALAAPFICATISHPLC